MKRRLDKMDRAILDCLYDDVRRSNRNIAAALHVTEGTVRSRIKRMQRDGLVRFTATLGAESTYQPLSGFIGISVIADNTHVASEALASLPEINFVGKMLGRYDIFCTYVVRSNKQLAGLLQDKIPKIPGVKSTESLQVIEVFKFDRRWSVLVNAQA